MNKVAESCREIETLSKLPHRSEFPAGSLEPEMSTATATIATQPAVQSMISYDAAERTVTIRTMDHLLSTVQGECAEASDWMREFYADREKGREWDRLA